MLIGPLLGARPSAKHFRCSQNPYEVGKTLRKQTQRGLVISPKPHCILEGSFLPWLTLDHPFTGNLCPFIKEEPTSLTLLQIVLL